MIKFARFNIAWKRGSAVSGAEHCTFISDTYVIREGEHPGLLFLEHLSNKCVFCVP